MVTHRVGETNQALRTVAAASGLWHESIRRLVLHTQKPPEQPEASRSTSQDQSLDERRRNCAPIEDQIGCFLKGESNDHVFRFNGAIISLSTLLQGDQGEAERP
jgi:hypothetical protein